MDSNLTANVADELVNEILESALDIAIKVSETAVKWRELTENNILANETDVDVNETRNKSPNFQEGFNQISPEKEPKETAPLALEVKKFLNEMMSPPYEIVNYDKAPVKGGLGDQTPTGIAAEQKPVEPPQIEKKSRVTDLIKNSRQVLSEYIRKERSKKNADKAEETQEKFIQSIELDCVKPGDKPFKARKKYIPENIPLPPDNEEEIEEIIRVQPEDHTMDVVDLPSKTIEGITAENTHGAKGDESNNYNMIFVLSPNENVRLNEGESPSSVNVVSEGSSNVLKDAVKEVKEKKKKRNFGSRLIALFKKHPKEQEMLVKK